MEFNDKEFCSRLTALRIARNLSKYEASIQADIHYPYYCLIENGNKTPNFKAVISIANALKTDLSALINDENLNGSVEDITRFKILSKLDTLNDTDLLKKFLQFAIMLRTNYQVKNND